MKSTIAALRATGAALFMGVTLTITGCSPTTTTTVDTTDPMENTVQDDSIPADDGPAQSPEPSEPASPTGQPTWDNVPVAEDLPPTADMWVALGDSELAVDLMPCQTEELEGVTVMVRAFEDSTGAWQMTAVTLGFADEATATRAHQQIMGFYDDCAENWDREGEVLEWIKPGEIPVPEGLSEVVEAATIQLSGATVAIVEDGEEEGLISSGTVVQVGDRLTWLISQGMGMDFNCALVADGDVGQCAEFAVAADLALRLAL